MTTSMLINGLGECPVCSWESVGTGLPDPAAQSRPAVGGWVQEAVAWSGMVFRAISQGSERRRSGQQRLQHPGGEAWDTPAEELPSRSEL